MTSMPQLSNIATFPVNRLDLIPESNQALSEELTRLAGHINAAHYRFLKLLAALIERNVWGGDSGMKTPAHWLNYYCGIDLGAAREKVRVSKALQSLPLIDHEFSSGAISYSKVRAMTRSATPENEAYLLDIARHGTAQHMEKLVRQYQRVERLNRKEQGQKQHAVRELSFYYDEAGMLVIKGRFAPEEGAMVVKAIEASIDSIQQESCEQPATFPRKRGDGISQSTPDVSAETSVIEETTLTQKRADAVLRVAEHFLATHHDGACALPGGDKYQVLIHINASAMRPEQKHGLIPELNMSAQLADGPPISSSTVRRLACDAGLVAVLEDSRGNILNIGRKSRSVPPAIRRALLLRDRACRYPGCGNTKFVDAHHIHHWHDGGETSLDNLVLLCRYHHRLLHEHSYSIEKDQQRNFRFINATGREIAAAVYPQFEVPVIGANGETPLEFQHAEMGLDIDATTAVTLWRGETMDYAMAVEGMSAPDSMSQKVSFPFSQFNA